MNHYHTSDGERISQATLERRILRAKHIKKSSLDGEYCEECGRCGVVLDMSHDVSVQWAKNNNQAELCYEVDNLTLRCRDCHNKHDGNI